MQVTGARLQAKYAPAYERKISSWAGAAPGSRAPLLSAAPTGFAAPLPPIAAPQLMKQDLSNSQV